MTDDSILNSEGLKKSINNRRAQLHKLLYHSSQVVFLYGRVVGLIFNPGQFEGVVNNFPASESHRAHALKMFNDHARPWGAVGQRVFPIELLDGLLDFLSGVTSSN